MKWFKWRLVQISVWLANGVLIASPILILSSPLCLPYCPVPFLFSSSFLSFQLSPLLPSPSSPFLLQVHSSKERYHHTLTSPYLLRLASVNSSSLCAVWDVSQACVLADFTLGQKLVHDLQWLSTSVSHSAADPCMQVCVQQSRKDHASYIIYAELG